MFLSIMIKCYVTQTLNFIVWLTKDPNGFSYEQLMGHILMQKSGLVNKILIEIDMVTPLKINGGSVIWDDILMSLLDGKFMRQIKLF